MHTIRERISEQSKTPRNAVFLPNLLGKLCDAVMSGRIQLVLFGAGSAGVHLWNALKFNHVPINCFCDNNPQIVGGSCSGRPVISIDELRQRHQESLIVISTSPPHSQEIRDQLLHLGFPSDRIHTPLFDPLIYYTNASNLYWPDVDLMSHAQQLQETYDLLSDTKSRDLFIHRMGLLTGCIDYASFQKFIGTFADLISDHGPNLFSAPVYDDNYFYFNSDFFPLKNDEVFANIGALIGDCAVKFVKTCEKRGLQYKEIINFEPDLNNFLQLSEKMNHFENVRCLPYGLWSHKSRMRFFTPNPFSAGTVGYLNTEGNIKVDLVSLDELLHDTDISLIKMDVEGAEMEALRGAAETIRRNMPKLAISVYHKRDDIFEIPLFIHRLHPGYKFYLRHYSTTFSETVLFAVP